MIAKNNINAITSLINDLSRSLHSLVSKNEAGASLSPTPLNIYRAASLIYQLRRAARREEAAAVAGGGGHPKEDSSAPGGTGNDVTSLSCSNIISNQVEKAFDTILNSLDDSYLSSVILKDINAAFHNLTERAMTSLHELTLHPNVRKNKECAEKDLSNCLDAMKSLNVLYCGRHAVDGDVNDEDDEDTIAMRCCRLGFSPTLCSHIAFLYDAVCQVHSILSPELRDCLLGTLSSLLCHGLIIPSISNCDDNDEDDAIQSVMTTIQLISTEQGQDSTCLGDLLQWQEELNLLFQKPSHTLKSLIESTFSDQVLSQKEYVLHMLESSPRTILSRDNYNASHTTTTTTKTESKLDDGQYSKSKSSTSSIPNKISLSNHNHAQSTRGLYQSRLVSKIHELFPSYGEGYLEAALVCYDHDVERTALALVELQSNPNSSSSAIHPRLKALDPKLPSRRKGGKERYDATMETEEDLEAREIQRAHLKEIQIQQENEAFLLSAAMGGEYNDEYDDQYDGIGEGEDGVGGMDNGLYDADYDAIKAYNKVTRELEADRLFWNENRNTNQQRKKNKGRDGKNDGGGDDDKDYNDDDENDDGGSGSGEKKYRGPDKGKGGRIIGPDGKYLPFPKSKKRGGDKEASDSQTQVKKGGNNGSTSKKTSEEMSKLQKRRKNDNKAKIANHHRKERSLKKSAGM